MTIAAIHAGGIEPLSGEIAEAVAGEEFNLYALQGIRAHGNDELRVPVGRYDEMRLRELMRRSQIAISVDGCPEPERVIHIGGRNRRLKGILLRHLEEAGCTVSNPRGPGPAHDPRLFYNTCTLGGVHIEFSQGLRDSMVAGASDSPTPSDGVRCNERFQTCVRALREGIGRYRQEMRDDLDAALRRFEANSRAMRRRFGLDDDGAPDGNN